MASYDWPDGKRIAVVTKLLDNSTIHIVKLLDEDVHEDAVKFLGIVSMVAFLSIVLEQVTPIELIKLRLRRGF